VKVEKKSAFQKAINLLVWWEIAKVVGSEAKEGLLPSSFKKNVVRMYLDLSLCRRLKDSKTLRPKDWRQEDQRLVCHGLWLVISN